MYIKRALEPIIEKALIPGRAVILYGPRRVGKTTLVKEILSKTKQTSLFLNCDDPSVRDELSNISLSSIKALVSKFDIIVFDEAQRVQNIGITIKLIVDEIPEKYVIVTGSSSIELANSISESLTGRKKSFLLYPISISELAPYYQSIELKQQVDRALIYGTYPVALQKEDTIDIEDYLLELSQDNLYKDALEYQQVKNPEQIRKLLTAIALQVGSEVSFTELANRVGVDQKTVIRYIDLLEKNYVLFRLPAFSRNLRSEINKGRKIYFYDLGVRNALINNFNNYDLRTDRGGAWENFLIVERMKFNAYNRQNKNYYFWRSYSQKEIDFIEESGGILNTYEFKWQKTQINPPKDFFDTYPNSTFVTINKDNYLPFIIGE